MLIQQTNLDARFDTSSHSIDNRPVFLESGAQVQTDRAMEVRAAVLLYSHPHLQHFSSNVQCCFRDRCLCLAGAVPSFYLKQLAQETLRGMPGVERIENRIAVVAPLPGFSGGSESHPWAPHSEDYHVPTQPR